MVDKNDSGKVVVVQLLFHDHQGNKTSEVKFGYATLKYKPKLVGRLCAKHDELAQPPSGFSLYSSGNRIFWDSTLSEKSGDATEYETLEAVSGGDVQSMSIVEVVVWEKPSGGEMQRSKKQPNYRFWVMQKSVGFLDAFQEISEARDFLLRISSRANFTRDAGSGLEP
ncbi:hypothetical protein [Xanthomonas vesicatoria]|uniref:Uncharacterized protein n=1 Tax=Xanthomonas vesicatoria TaxID=56460 RepID=A0ABS8LFQ2_9XANT|nr:hypothetical protein [Xanthomonas vesicatoria]MCC8624587.1 hypothetical protein [Xanthomonas vesicatoria]MCC8693463.1 hypothetical protein [Xanthomonas vesicatoria]MCC8703729.1 hypothetical protein [Xanthomonas vesicatoria]MDG4489850.1 hypothetical protein [Xanthomonas vesicatoria]